MVSSEKILDSARRERVDAIGLSGLITPSLDEMVHVATEMQRKGMQIPLLIGGATTSKAHTAVKIAPAYDGTVVHVTDASAGVKIAAAVLSHDGADEFASTIRDEYAEFRVQYHKRGAGQKLAPLQDARANRLELDWEHALLAAPEEPGIHVFDDVPLEVLRDYIDWTPFFQTWELRGRYPAILDHPEYGPEATKLFSEAQSLLDHLRAERRIRASAVCGLFRASAEGEDVALFDPEREGELLTTLHFLRQQTRSVPGKPYRSLADFIAPAERGLADHMGLFCVTAGRGLSEVVREFEDDQDDYSAILARALADRLAEACAEWLHEKVRRSLWGYTRDEDLSNQDLIREAYLGIRPAPGYPACPDHKEKTAIFDLLSATENIGVTLTEQLAMSPAASVCGYYFACPEAHYFALGKIGRDQVEDLAWRRGETVEEVERWLAPNLAYR
jgi:5-methyltetrahydrofolate--homocysteine methyltransferase